MESNKHRGMSDREASPPAQLPATSFGGGLLARDNQPRVQWERILVC